MENYTELNYKIFDQKTSETEKKLEYNYLFQIIIVGLSLCYIFEKIDFLIIISNHFSIDNIGVLEFIFPILLLYLFVRFGYYLTHFFLHREVNDKLYRKIVKDSVNNNNLEITAFRPYFYEFYYQMNNNNNFHYKYNYKYKYKKINTFDKIKILFIDFIFKIFFSFITLVISLNHSLIFFFIYNYFDNILLKVISYIVFGGILFFCYIQYYVVNKRLRTTKGNIIITIILSVIFGFALFNTTSYYFLNRLLGNYNFQQVNNNIHSTGSHPAIETVIKVKADKDTIYKKIKEWIEFNYSTKYDEITNEDEDKGLIEGYGNSILKIKNKNKVKQQVKVYYKYIFEVKNNKFKVKLYLDLVGNDEHKFYSIPKELTYGIKNYPGMEITTYDKSIIAFEKAMEKAIEKEIIFKNLKLFIEDKIWLSSN